MARLWHAGAEIDAAVSTAAQAPDGGHTGAVTRDTATFRSGLASFKCDSGAGNATAYVSNPTTFPLSATYFIRFYVNAAAAPGTAAHIFGNAAATFSVRMRTDGGIELLTNSAVQGSASASIADGTWHRIEVMVTFDAASITATELRLDGATLGTFSGSASPSTAWPQFGWFAAPGANKVIYVDDIAINNSSGAVNNTWCGDGKVVLLKPVADSAVGASWTNDAASATNIFNAVANTPPQGIADTAASTGLHQIRNAGANTSYDAQLGAYSDSVASGGGGMKTLDIVNAVIPVVTAGAPVSTGAKSGSFGIVSNPAITNRVFTGGSGTATFFWRGAAAGTYPSNWGWEAGTITEAPSVTLATKPVARLTITGGTVTRIAMSCAIGLYVDFTPSKSLAHSPRRRNLVIR